MKSRPTPPEFQKEIFRLFAFFYNYLTLFYKWKINSLHPKTILNLNEGEEGRPQVAAFFEALFADGYRR